MVKLFAIQKGLHFYVLIDLVKRSDEIKLVLIVHR